MVESDGTFTRVIKNLEFRNWGRTVENKPAVYGPDPHPSPDPNPKLTLSNLTLALHLPKQFTFFPHSKVAVCNIVKWSLENGYQSHADKYVLRARRANRPHPSTFRTHTFLYPSRVVRYSIRACGMRALASCRGLLAPLANKARYRVTCHHTGYTTVRASGYRHTWSSLYSQTGQVPQNPLTYNPSLNVYPISIRLSPALLPTV